MLQPSHIMVLVLFGVIAWFWRDSLAARELAIEAARRTCKSTGVQFLDQTVSIAAFWPMLGNRGLRFKRRYRFEFSTDGTDRHPGQAELYGRRVARVHLDYPSGLVLSDEEKRP
ncbi:DUF3301 domain-containing protein [Gammaproteobacteria bacterium AB-CW1]|uniref:DUF3301 domain-containing protein n=1 Tax=Natronospira elongata TaxID=3110268 RepID=A0AAP6MJZ4_9GAMM|nr:DUF3301 domain-containing protein [Gammaproteobacteria bacterium AB-CW1]